MTKDYAPTPGMYDPYNPTPPEALEAFLVTSETDLPPGYEFLHRDDRILEPTPDGRTTLQVLVEKHGQNIKLVQEGSGHNIYKFAGLKVIE